MVFGGNIPPPSVPGNGSKRQGQSQGDCSEFLPFRPRQMPLVSEWPVQGVEVAAWESSPHRTQVIGSLCSLELGNKGTWELGREKGLQGSRVLVGSASLNSMHVISGKIEPNCPAISQLGGHVGVCGRSSVLACPPPEPRNSSLSTQLSQRNRKRLFLLKNTPDAWTQGILGTYSMCDNRYASNCILQSLWPSLSAPQNGVRDGCHR